jgi:hypothetical protein
MGRPKKKVSEVPTEQNPTTSSDQGSATRISPEFAHYGLTEESKAKMIAVRRKYSELLIFLNETVPADTRYAALAKTALEESCLWTIKNLVINSDGNVPDHQN